ncbi:DNA repair exonuclease [Thioflavicoccus mobilis 8321]|uniref:DNA repair exonuclease n=1 Tax=Thioflavicoccus mobilis 8321 TaxID=765912 RepID=L0GWL9_9GAMM|nr:DNA repair exonuclease [Thioflavicoccus mobilis]AGA91153.1 DNA repair exonuclease [Thioflavicoccus mobilis 8321]
MFRFLHAADIHLDSPMLGLEAYEGAPVAVLREATRRAFEGLVRLALDEAVDFVVIAGDLYDGDWRDFSTGLFFSRQVARLHEVGIPVYLIAGNHDAASVLTRRLTLPPNVHAFSTRAAESNEVPGLPVVIHGRGFPHRAVPENLVPDYPPPVPGMLNIGLLHTSLTGAPGHDSYAPCTLRDLTGKGYDYWALGHVHQPQVLARDPWVVFAGNLQGRHIRESGPRGAWLVTVGDGREIRAVEHRHLDVVRWARVAVDIAGLADPAELAGRVGETLQAALTGADGRPLAARLTLTGATALHDHLKRDLPHVRADCLAQAQIVAGDEIWVEEVEVATAPVYDLADLAARDELTGIVLETLHAAGDGDLALPPEAQDMLRVLPPEIRAELQADLEGKGRAALLEDVRAILLETLARKGGAA